MNLVDKCKRIKAVILDVDGILTDCRFGYGKTPGEVKFFNARDGHGMKLLMRSGIKVGLLSGRGSSANRRRAEELHLDFIYENCKNKGEIFADVLLENGLQADECLYMGDDIIDLPVMSQVAISFTVADAVDEVLQYADFITKKPGGYGAVREMAEWLLKNRGDWAELMKRYLPNDAKR